MPSPAAAAKQNTMKTFEAKKARTKHQLSDTWINISRIFITNFILLILLVIGSSYLEACPCASASASASARISWGKKWVMLGGSLRCIGCRLLGCVCGLCGCFAWGGD